VLYYFEIRKRKSVTVSSFRELGISWLNRYPDRDGQDLGRYLLLKRVFDLVVCLLMFPFIGLVLLVCGVLIYIESPGAPVVFVQQRTGKGGRRFNMYKFRSMVPNAELLKKDLAHLNELQWPDFKITNDPRITRIGRFMRKTSLDEFPQFINVIKGEMSLVGPRPTSFSAKTYRLWQTERLDVVPGITGVWQVVGRGETEFNQRLILDIAYIKKRCFLLDIEILFRTVGAVLKTRGAH
jgi:lipopolysaccharide/colanic/teichoic acid biosynthesis glycosyltransferase